MSNLDRVAEITLCEDHAEASCIQALPTRDSIFSVSARSQRILERRPAADGRLDLGSGDQ